MTCGNVACMQPDGAAHNSWLRSSRESGISALNEPDLAPRLGFPVPFGSAQPSHGCVRDTDQLVELHHIDITDAAAQKKSGHQFIRSRCTAHSRPNTCTRAPHAPLPRVAEDRRTSRRPPESRQCMGWIEATWIHQNHRPRPALASPTWHHRRSRDSHLHAP